jgi:hypothetical protein
MRKLLSLLVVCLSLSVSTLAQSLDQSANGREMKGAFTFARAMELVYGSYDYSQMLSRWTPRQTKQPTKSFDVWSFMDMPYVENGTAKHLVITTASPQTTDPTGYTCHSCAPLIGLVLFEKMSDRWVVEASDLQFGNYGAFGQPPPMSLAPIGTGRYGLMMTTSFGSTGEWEKSVTIIIPTKGKFLKAFSVQTEGSSGWNCSENVAEEQKNDCFSYDGDVDMLPSSGSEYFDLLVTKRVYRSFSKKQPVGTTVTRYRFAGSRYLLEK